MGKSIFFSERLYSRISSADTLYLGFRQTASYWPLIFVDLFWKALFAFAVAAAVIVVVVWIGADLQSISLDPAAARNPAAVLAAIRFWWQSAAPALLGLVALLVSLLAALWLMLGSYFRAGMAFAAEDGFFKGARENFWIFVASRLGRYSIRAAAVIAGWALTAASDSGSGVAVVVVMVCIVEVTLSGVETVIRMDAVEESARSLESAVASIGAILLMDGLVVVLSIVFWANAMPRLYAWFPLVVAAPIHSYLVLMRHFCVGIIARHAERA